MASAPAKRFDPPPLAIDGTTLWVLRRAFGPVEPAVTPPPRPEQALAEAGALGVAPRIAARAVPGDLKEDLGEEVAAGFERAKRKAVEATLGYDALAAQVTRHAAALDQPVVFLKGFALHAGGHATPGSRQVGDLDVLVSPRAARPLHAALQRAGFRPAAAAANEQHLEPLAAPGWGVVDVHYAIRGVSSAAGPWLDAAAAIADDLAREVAPGAWVPGPRTLAAHALAHAIEQHGNNPRPYPLLRMMADLQDLLPDDAAWEGAMPHLTSALSSTLEPSEIEGTRDLALILAAEAIPEDPQSEAHRILAHLLAHALDPDYRASLGRAHLFHRLRQARRRGTLLRYAGRKLLDLWQRLAAAP